MFCYLLGQLLGILYPICTNRMVYPNLLWWSEWEFPHILRHLNNYLVCSWWHCLRRIRPWVLSGGSMSQSFEVSKKIPYIQIALSVFCLWLKLVAQAVPATVSGDRYFVCSPQWWQSLHSGTLSQKQTSTFIGCLGHGILYNNRKVAKTLQIPLFFNHKRTVFTKFSLIYNWGQTMKIYFNETEKIFSLYIRF